RVEYFLGAALHPLASQAGGRRADAGGRGLARQETVADEKGLFDRQAKVAPLQIAGAIALDAVREDQILGASRGAHPVGLDKPRRAIARKRLVGLKRLRIYLGGPPPRFRSRSWCGCNRVQWFAVNPASLAIIAA